MPSSHHMSDINAGQEPAGSFFQNKALIQQQVYPIHQVKRWMLCYSLIFPAKELCAYHAL